MFAFYNIHQLPLFQPESNCGTTNHDNSRLFRHLGENLVDLKIVSTFDTVCSLKIVSMLSNLLVRGYVETPFYSCQTRKTHLSHWGSFGQELQLSGWIRWSFFVKYLSSNFELFQAADEVALLVGKGFHISRKMHFQDKRVKNGCETLFLSRLTLMPHRAGMILRKILT